MFSSVFKQYASLLQGRMIPKMNEHTSLANSKYVSTNWMQSSTQQLFKSWLTWSKYLRTSSTQGHDILEPTKSSWSVLLLYLLKNDPTLRSLMIQSIILVGSINVCCCSSAVSFVIVPSLWTFQACAPRYYWRAEHDTPLSDVTGTCYLSVDSLKTFVEYAPCRTGELLQW